MSPGIHRLIDWEDPSKSNSIQHVHPVTGILEPIVIIPVAPGLGEVLTEVNADLKIDEFAVAVVAVSDGFGDADAVCEAVVSGDELVGELRNIVTDGLDADLVLDELGTCFNEEARVLVVGLHKREDLSDPNGNDKSSSEHGDVVPASIRTDRLLQASIVRSYSLGHEFIDPVAKKELHT